VLAPVALAYTTRASGSRCCSAIAVVAVLDGLLLPAPSAFLQRWHSSKMMSGVLSRESQSTTWSRRAPLAPPEMSSA
jgi:hypothetical protein